jgi:SAM-dependent methyltransferase
MEWWQTFFNDVFLQIWAPIVTPEQTAQTVAGIQAALKLEPGAEILDLACGQGRIAVPLAQAGYRLTGLDYAERLLEAAQQAAADAGVQIAFHHADMREIPVAWKGRFDAVVNIWTAFGYFESDAEDQKVLAGVAMALKPGGQFLIDVAHRDRIARDFMARDWRELPDGSPLWTQRIFDPISGITGEDVSWLADGQIHRRSFRVRTYTATELTRMLQGAGLQPTAYYGDWELNPFKFDSRRLIILSAKQEES